MADTRILSAKKNICVSLCCQMITLICGIIIPQQMINAFGSEVYGATVSIAQFLSYITLLEGGIGGVARAALYKPLADQDIDRISAVMAEIKRFFRIVGCIFLLYVLVIACSFNLLSNTAVLDWTSTFFLVIAISTSTFSQYFIGISNMILLQAAQRQYLTNLINIAGIVVNTLLVVLLISLKRSIVEVKLVSGVVFAIKPVILWLCVRSKYHLRHVTEKHTNYLKQKWSGIGQHIAFFLHSNTDVVILTCFTGLKPVAVYSVYNMVVGNMQNLVSSFLSGMEAIFGDMLAKKEEKQLNNAFEIYETIISIAAVVLFSVTAVMILPFVKLYTANVTDANYHAPIFAYLLIMSALVNCLRMPYHAMVIAAGHFKQTRVSAYSEAIINVLLSIVLVPLSDLAGVAFATFVATLFRMVYYAFYLSKNIVKRRVRLLAMRSGVNATVLLLVFIVGKRITALFTMTSYGVWALCGIMVTVASMVITVAINVVFYRQNCRALLAAAKRRR